MKRPAKPQESGVNLGAQQVLDRLPFSPEGLIDAATEQAELFALAIGVRIAALKEFNRAKMHFDKVSATAAQELRNDAASEGLKVTENSIAEALKLNPDIEDALSTKASAEEQEELSKLLIDACRIRRDSIRVIADMSHYNVGAGGAGEEPAELRTVRDAARNRYARK